jgi:hypothetical protein
MDNQDSLYSIRNCIFGFQCTSNSDEMSHTSSASDDTEVRFCSGCEKEVYQCVTDDELTHNIQLNRCVVINRSGIYDTRGLPVLDFKLSKLMSTSSNKNGIKSSPEYIAEAEGLDIRL